MHRHIYEENIRRKELELELALAEFLEAFPEHPYRKDQLLFEFDFDNLKILQPMNVTKKIGAFTGKLVFKDAEGDLLDISKATNVTLVADNAAVGNVTLAADGTFSGSGIAAGTLTLTASLVNDAGATITGSSTITFSADTTITSVEPVIN